MQQKKRKYRILARVPGRLGRRYQNKLNMIRAFEVTQSRFLAALKECVGMKCIDIGANVGNYTRTMATFASHVYAIEPDPVAFNQLASVAKGLPNVTLMNACAGVSNEKTRIYRTKEFQSNPQFQPQGSSMFMASHLSQNNFIECDQVNVIELIEDVESEIGVIKIDAEGAEVPILESLLARRSLLKRIRYVFAETHERIWPENKRKYEEFRRRANEVDGAIIDLSWH